MPMQERFQLKTQIEKKERKRKNKLEYYYCAILLLSYLFIRVDLNPLQRDYVGRFPVLSLQQQGSTKREEKKK